MMRTLFLQAPSFDGFDGGAGARYQMRREIQSFWYPTWLAQPAALVEGSKLVDAPPHRLKFHDITPEAAHRDLVVLHTSTPSFSVDVRTAEALKALKPSWKRASKLRRRSTLSRATSSISPSRTWRRDATSAALPGSPGATPPASSCTTRTAPSSRTWTSCPLSRRFTSATSSSRIISAAI